MRTAILSLALAALLAVGVGTVEAEVSQKGNLRVAFTGKIAPHDLPRARKAPIAVTLSGAIETVDGKDPPQLRTISLALNRNGEIDYTGLPVCNLNQIQPATSEEARSSCGGALVGRGTFNAHVALPEQSPFPSKGRVLAFNGRLDGKPVIYAHIYGTRPLPQSFVLTFRLQPGGNGVTRLVANLPRVAAKWGFVSGVSLTLQRSFNYRHQRHSYLSAGCPAPHGFPGGTFDFARVSFGFEDGRSLASHLIRSCAVRG